MQTLPTWSIHRRLVETAPNSRPLNNLRYFVIVSEQRSGSDLLVSLLDSHPNIRCYSEWFKGRNSLTLKQAFREMQSDLASSGARDVQWLGFKLMLSQLDSVKGVLGDSNVVVLFHWRRNVLRQMISNSANHLDKVLAPAGQHQSHPRTVEEAAVIAKKTMPYIPSEHLDSEISDHFQQRCRIMQTVRELGVRTCPVSHMEDLAAMSHRRKATWLIESCLGVRS